jgi:D-glycero-beta-D-manno-heptose-7-phosphate kinase
MFFFYGTCKRMEPSCPVAILEKSDIKENLGMAGNVYKNILSLGAKAELICNENYKNIIKTRYVEKKTNHMFVRVDITENISRIKNLHKINFNKYSAVIISDYNKGFLTEEDIQYIAKNNPVTFLDTKKILGDWAKNIRYIKINRGEYENSRAEILRYKLTDKMIITLGEGGCKYKDKIYPVKKVEVRDLSGAGDSFLAALVVKYLEKFNMDESLVAANEAATIVVQKMGVSLIKEK